MKYSKTQAGQQAFKERSVLLSARQRSAFILFDGVKTLAQVLESTAGLGITQADVDHMVAQGFLAGGQPLDAGVPVAPADTPDADQTLASSRTEQERYAEAWPIATRLTASLGLRGFRLNLAVEAAGGYEALLALLPKIQEAVGTQACTPLAVALKG